MLFSIILLFILIFLPSHTFVWRWITGTTAAIDCACNCFFLLGDWRETVSGRVGKAYHRGVLWIVPFYYFINLLFWIVNRDMEHCNDAIDPNVGVGSSNDKTIWKW